MKTFKFTTSDCTEYRLGGPNGKHHNLDGPAISFTDGHQEYWVNGVLHRTDGPAIISKGGDKSYYQNGVYHRLDGPAVDWVGTKMWYINGILHRDNGPAIIWASGQTEFWSMGQRYYPERKVKVTQDMMISHNVVSLEKFRKAKNARYLP